MKGIEFFYQKDEHGSVTFDEDNNPILRERGQTATIGELRTLISQGRPQRAIEAYKSFVVNGMDWDKYDSWKSKQEEYESLLIKYTEEMEKYEQLSSEEQAEKSAPVSPEVPEALSFEPATLEQVDVLLNPELKKQDKRLGKEVAGHTVSLTEENQNGIAAVLKGVELAAKYGQDIFPLNFKAMTATGSTLIEFTAQEDFELFALDFMAKRKEYF
jgi:hypothetical protein